MDEQAQINQLVDNAFAASGRDYEAFVLALMPQMVAYNRTREDISQERYASEQEHPADGPLFNFFHEGARVVMLHKSVLRYFHKTFDVFFDSLAEIRRAVDNSY